MDYVHYQDNIPSGATKWDIIKITTLATPCVVFIRKMANRPVLLLVAGLLLQF